MRDGMLCHMHAMDLMRRLNSNDDLTPESDLVAAAIVAPEEEIIGESGAPTFAATSCVVLLCAYLTFLF